MTNKKKSVLVIFSKEAPRKSKKWYERFDEIIYPKDLKNFVGPGNIQEAYELVNKISRLGVSKSVNYKGYELWWMNYETIHENFCLPYTKYRNLLTHIKNFDKVYLFQPLPPDLFRYFCQAHNIQCSIFDKFKLRNLLPFSLGGFIQIFLSIIFLPWLKIRGGKNKAMVWTSDKFDPPRDHNFRVKFIYEELRKRKVPFIEFIRSMEKWYVVLAHALKRKRPVFYSTAIIDFIYLTTPRSNHILSQLFEPEERFWFLISAHYLKNVKASILSIKIMQVILRWLGVKVAYTSVGGSRNYHEILACKLNGIKTIGIQHGIGPRYDFPPDFMPEFSGKNQISVDEYGLWSEWWLDYYKKYSRAYKAEQLFVSGPMRPLRAKAMAAETESPRGDSVSQKIKVLLMSEELTSPEELIPYHLAVLNEKDFEPYFKFRPYRDKFEFWLKENRPDIYKMILEKTKVLRGSMEEAISQCDAVVGSRSTAVLEALMQIKPCIFFWTQKCGDYFEMKSAGLDDFFAQNPREFIERIKKSKDIPEEKLRKLREQFFGNPYQNGSAWVVDRIEKYLKI